VNGTPRRRGRRPLGPHERINLRLPQDLYDVICALALKDGVEVTDYVRSLLRAAAGLPHQPKRIIHRYRGGLPPKRLRLAAIRHVMRANKFGVRCEAVDLRDVFHRSGGKCGICDEPVSFDEFIVDHIVPMSAGGSHTIENLQAAHHACNDAKGKAHGPIKLSRRVS
jgi:5-methylcytosine-specific restriction endonuclease McrA